MGRLGIVALVSGPAKGVLKYAAEHCFWQLPLADLRKICADCGLTNVGKDTFSHLQKLVTACLPKADVAELKRIFAQRALPSVDPMLTPLSDDAVASCFEEDDLKAAGELGSNLFFVCHWLVIYLDKKSVWYDIIHQRLALILMS